MWKEKIRGYAIVEYRRLLFLRAVILFFVLFAALLLIRSYTTGLSTQSEAAPALSEHRVLADSLPFQGMKDAVLEWMKRSSEMPDEILSRIYDEASGNPNSDLLLAICKVESNFNPNIKSHKEALGLMGIRPAVWLSELKDRKILQSRRDLYLIRTNLASGAYVLQKYLMKRGKLEEALNDYVGGDPDYVKRVVQALGEIYEARMLYAESHAATMAEVGVGKDGVRNPSEG
jgi:soluble lytic murein transglycosylase-like protein